MKFRRVMWVAQAATFSAVLTLVGVANAGPVVNPGYDLFESLPCTTFGGVAFQGVPIGTFNFGGTIGTKSVGVTDRIIQRLAPAGAGARPTFGWIVRHYSRRSRIGAIWALRRTRILGCCRSS